MAESNSKNAAAETKNEPRRERRTAPGRVKPIIAFTGPEGSGKSCAMTFWGLREKRISLDRNLPTRFFSFPGYDIYDRKDNKVTETLSADKWTVLPDWLRDAWIFIDEAQNFFNSLRSNTTMAELFTNVLAQRRRRDLGIVYTIQDWQWFNGRMRWLTHIMATCFDQYWILKRDGKTGERGRHVYVRFYDCKGFYSGTPWTPSLPFRFHAEPFWKYYDSYGYVDAFAGMFQVKIKRPQLEIDLSGGDGEDKAPPIPADGAPPSHNELLEQLAAQHVSPRMIANIVRHLK